MSRKISARLVLQASRLNYELALSVWGRGEAKPVPNGVANARKQVVCNRLTPQGETDTNEEIQTTNLVIRIYLAWPVLKRNADATDALRYLLATEPQDFKMGKLRRL